MNTTERDEKLKSIFMDVFDINESQFSSALSKDDLENWDSLAHVTLVLSLESAFDVQFSPEEAESLTSVRMIQLTLDELSSVTQ